MRLNAFILALCVCVYHTRAASINVQEKKLDDLDNVDLDNVEVSNTDLENIVKETEIKPKNSNEDIPVKVVEESVLNENSNDYIPPDDSSVIVKRFEVDLDNPGPPQRQEHETQNPEHYGDKEKTVFAIKQTIEIAENIFNEGLQSVSNSFRTFFSPEEDLPLIQQNIKSLKQTFTDQIEKVNSTIKAYLKPEITPSDVKKSEVNPNLEIVNSRLTLLEKNFKTGIDTLSEGVELYSIIKEEDEAEKLIAGKTDLKQESGSSEKPTSESSSSPPFEMPWNQYLTNLQNSVSNAITNLNVAISNTFNGGNNNNSQQTPAQGNNPVVNFFQGIGLTNLIPGQNNPSQTSTGQGQQPSNTQSDESGTTTSAPWGPQAFFQYLQNSFNGGSNPSQTNPVQQTIQNIVSFINPGQTSTTPEPTKPSTTSDKVPESSASDIPQDTIQSDSVVPAPESQQPQQAQPAPPNSVPAPVQVNPIQQLIQNNPIIKGIQDTVQRIQGTPNPNAPREEVVNEDNENNDEDADPKGHYHGGYGSNNGVANQVDNHNGDRVGDKLEEIPSIPSEAKAVAEEQLKAEELKTPSGSDKTE